MKKRNNWFLALSVLAAVFLTVVLVVSCGDKKTGDQTSPGDDDPAAITFSALSAAGSPITTTLTLIFNKDIDDLSAGDITLTAGSTGAAKGALSKTGTGTYDLTVTGITAGGTVTVTVSKTGYTITPSGREVTVLYGDPGDQVAFSGVSAGGSPTTTTLTLTFDQDIDGLSAGDITLTAGNTGAAKGTLSKTGTGVYELTVTGITAGGTVTVAVSKTGYTITPSGREVTVLYGTDNGSESDKFTV
jgi:hypothetical protein